MAEIEGKKPIPPGLVPWKKGESGNMAGRRKGSVNLGNALKRMMRKIDPDDPDKRSRAEVLALKMYELAKAGHAACIKEICARIAGPIPTVIEGPKEAQLLRVIGLPPTPETLTVARRFLHVLAENEPASVLQSARGGSIRAEIESVQGMLTDSTACRLWAELFSRIANPEEPEDAEAGANGLEPPALAAESAEPIDDQEEARYGSVLRDED